jgi:hypothetical protein
VTLATMVNAPVRVDARLFAEAEATECPDPGWQAFPDAAAELAADVERRWQQAPGSRAEPTGYSLPSSP